MAPISARELNRATLARQGLLEPIRASGAAAAIERLGSLQAQHPEWPPVALAARAADARTADLRHALDRREAVRSSLMRNTIHVVSAADLWPMFTVCQPLRLNQWRLLLKADPIESPLGRRMTAAHGVAVDALRDRPRSSLELDRLLMSEAGADATALVARAAWRHFAAFVPLVHVPHDGEGYGRSKYALAVDWLGEARPQIDDAAARVHVARRYLAAFGPASVEDLVAYVGRGKGGIGVWREAVAAIGDDLVTLTDEGGRSLHDLAGSPRPAADTPAPPRLLARWDSLLLSHAPKHRDRVIADQLRPAVFSRNADVLPTVLVDGKVAGTWDLRRRDGTVVVEVQPFGRFARSVRSAVEIEAHRIVARIEPDASDLSVAFAA